MKYLSLAAPIVAFTLAISCAFADSPAPAICGWRGDGAGAYPNADPPIHWHQISTAIEGLRYQPQPPAGDTPSGQPMPDGIIREWLVLAPIPTTKAEKDTTDSLFALDESKLAPAPGQKVDGSEWKSFPTDTAYVDFAKSFNTYGNAPEKAVYAAAYIYSPADAAFVINVNHTGTARLWINGKSTIPPTEHEMNYVPQFAKFHKGWNILLLRVTPQFGGDQRPINGTWYLNVDIRDAANQPAYDSKNIAWKTPLPSIGSLGPPIVVKGKIFLLDETADLLCLDEKTGKILWLRSNNYDELATLEEKTANPDIFKEIEPLQQKLQQINAAAVAGTLPPPQNVDGGLEFKDKTETQKKLYNLMKQVDGKKYALPKGQEVGYSGFTPVSDGQHVYAWFATGVSCCYDLDGKLIWRRLDNEGSFFEHGYSVSPFHADGKLVVFMNNLIAFDAKTGDRLWTTQFSGSAQTRFHGTPAPFKIGDTAYCVLPIGQIIRLSDGKIVHDKGPEISNRQQEIPSPVALAAGGNNTLYELSTYGFFNKVTLPAQPADPLIPVSVQKTEVDLNHYPTFYLDWFLSSPLIDNGLAYCMNNSGVLNVFDLNSMQLVYQKLLDIDSYQCGHDGAGRGVGISPTLAGGKIYFVGNTGTTLIIKPGRTYEEIAKNKIESVFPRYWSTRIERFVAAPVFDGKQMFLRGERYLYCIAE